MKVACVGYKLFMWLLYLWILSNMCLLVTLRSQNIQRESRNIIWSQSLQNLRASLHLLPFLLVCILWIFLRNSTKSSPLFFYFCIASFIYSWSSFYVSLLDSSPIILHQQLNENTFVKMISCCLSKKIIDRRSFLCLIFT